jgi:myo-inositol-1(or 4)-monophosphatase
LTGDLALAFEAAAAAGGVLMRAFGAGGEVRHKGPDQPVTEADLEADAVIRSAVLDARPDDGWLSEETLDRPDRLSRPRVWIVDPLDGTRSFINGYPEFAVSIALAVEGEAALGVVYNPARSELFWAVQGGGAFVARGWAGGAPAGRRLQAIGTENAVPVILASRTELARQELARFSEGWQVKGLGSTAYKLAVVASGSADAFLSRGPKSEWDVAAGALIVAEAGGVATDRAGAALQYNRPDPHVHGILGATRAAHGTLLRMLEDME